MSRFPYGGSPPADRNTDAADVTAGPRHSISVRALILSEAPAHALRRTAAWKRRHPRAPPRVVWDTRRCPTGGVPQTCEHPSTRREQSPLSVRERAQARPMPQSHGQSVAGAAWAAVVSIGVQACDEPTRRRRTHRARASRKSRPLSRPLAGLLFAARLTQNPAAGCSQAVLLNAAPGFVRDRHFDEPIRQ